MLLVLALLLATLLAILALFRWQADKRETRTPTEVAPLAGQYVSASDVRIFIQEEGPPDGPAVLFVHGTGAWSGAWRPTMTMLGNAGFHAIAIDLPPFGFSERPGTALYDKLDQGRRIIGVLEALKIQRVILVGHSFGGGPTMEAAFLQPGRVRGLVLVDVALSLQDGEGPRPSSLPMKAFFSAKPLRDAVVATFLTNPRFTRKLLGFFVDNPASATDDWIRIYQRPLVVNESTHAIGEWLPALLVPSRVSASERPASYRSLTMPVHIIWGDRDTITPLSQGRQLAAATPGATLTVMNGVGHIPQIEDGQKFNELLLRLVSSFEGRP